MRRPDEGYQICNQKYLLRCVQQELELLVPEFTTAGLFQPKNIYYLLRSKKEYYVGSKTEKKRE